jgi:hypothetical protein
LARTPEVRDTSAIIAYTYGSVAVGERLIEVEDDGGLVALPFQCLSEAASLVIEQNQTFLEDINPGNQVKGTLVFDVPQGTKLTSIVLHESMFTAGVKIPLTLAE